MRPLLLSGLMGTGKSTVGPVIAARLGVPFVDTDGAIERDTGRSVTELWSSEGEAAFRVREAALVAALLSDGKGRVIALGGGAMANPRTRRTAIDAGYVVTLTATPETIVARLGHDATRPLLASGGNALERVRELLAIRGDAYAESHLSIATDQRSPEAVADAIVAFAARDPLLVPLGFRSYTIDVCHDEPMRLLAAVRARNPSSVVLVTDENVWRARGRVLDEALSGVGCKLVRVTLTPGEANKTIDAVSRIWDGALEGRVDRDAVVIAAGGGVVGDLAGFAAASLLRGIRFVQVPTTLLSMVDASVGGKTGFDHPAGKNLIGAFHQPSAVVADLAHLATLHPRERRAGLAEVVKIALATDILLLERVEREAKALSAGHIDVLLPVVRAAIEAKIRVVRDDERENGARALLNLGHTVGHALEAHGAFSRWLHGEAVALGTVVEMQATAALGFTDPELVERVVRLFASLGLPTEVDTATLSASWRFVASDKKRGAAGLRLPVVTGPGRAHIEVVALTQLQRAVGA